MCEDDEGGERRRGGEGGGVDGVFFFFKQKTAYEIYQCDWSSDVCSSDLLPGGHAGPPLRFILLPSRSFRIPDNIDKFIKQVRCTVR